MYNLEYFFKFVENCPISMDMLVSDDATIIESSNHSTILDIVKNTAPFFSDDTGCEEDGPIVDIVDEFIRMGGIRETRYGVYMSEEEKSKSMIYQIMMTVRTVVKFAVKKFRIARNYLNMTFHENMEYQCLNWYEHETLHPPDYDTVARPPCSLGEALANPAFTADTSCSNGRPYCQFFQNGAYHCVRSKAARFVHFLFYFYLNLIQV